MMGLSASVLVALATMAAALDTEVFSLSHRQLTAGQEFRIETANRVYRGHLVDPETGECQMATSAGAAGTEFAKPRTVYLLGATAGPQPRQMFVLMHEVKVGLRMELGIGDLDANHRRITSQVLSIKLGG
jgi:hypothetical protein